MSFYLSNNPEDSFSKTFPFIVLSNIFSDQELEMMIKNFQSCGTVKALTLEDGEYTFDESQRISSIKKHVPNEGNIWIFEKLNKVAKEVNDQYFQFDLVGYKELQYTEYDSNGGHYAYHTDMVYGVSCLTRKLSFSLILSVTGQYEGGSFDFLVDPGKPTRVMQNKGDFIFFPSWNPHRITHEIKGSRKSLVGWIVGPKFK
jgi:PKHD-type hydroxylase